MWQLLDIAYVIPVCAFLGFWFGDYLLSQGYDYQVACIMISALLGIILTSFKIKKFIDTANKNSYKNSKSSDEQKC